MKTDLRETKIKKLIWITGIPMIISMVLQALYNIIDTAFVINMDPIMGPKANLALTFSFPVQIFMIAVGVGTGIGINALLSKFLGEKNDEGVKKVTGNSIFLLIIIFLIFLIFGLFLSKPFISFQTSDEDVLNMAASYLKIVCALSIGSVGFTIYERFLQANGKTLHTMIAQISGAITNIILDYVFIYPLDMGIEGAAYATIIGQILSFLLVVIFHYTINKEVKNSIKTLLPNFKIIKSIYFIGGSAALMQALLSVMMFGVNLILGTTKYNPTLMQNTFGIYYKIGQIPLFALFGLSNALITLTSFTKGANNKRRLKEIYKYGIISSIIVSLIITILYEALAEPIAKLFNIASDSTNDEIKNLCVVAIRISSISYVFMGITIAIQGILQGLRYSLFPLLLSLFRLVIFFFPIAYLFTLSENVSNLFWITFIISEFLTAVIALIISKKPFAKAIAPSEE